jgi:patatin-like phospholipase/acyl hydrolase
MSIQSVSGRKFRILALDGGGIRGLVTARILQELETQIGQPLNQYFDLIAGTSTGSILAAGLVMGMAPSKLIEIYQERGREIFPDRIWDWPRKNLLSWVYGAKYSNQGLKKVLQEEFQKLLAENGGPKNYNIKFDEIHQYGLGSRVTGNGVTGNGVTGNGSGVNGTTDNTTDNGHQADPSQRAKLLILAHNTLQRQTTFFVSPPVDTPAPWYADRELWEICLSSASAPTFFPPYWFKDQGIAIAGQITRPTQSPSAQSYKAHTYIDGGVSANTPSLAALVHAMDIEKQPLDNIAVLSIGTGKTTNPYEYQQIRHWGAVGWVNALADVFMGSQIQISADLCGQLLCSAHQGHPDGDWNYLRLQFPMNRRINSEGEFLPPQEQYNEYLYEAYQQDAAMAAKSGSELKQAAKLNEAMDDASPQNLAKLLQATEAFLSSQDTYREAKNVRTAIANWISAAASLKFPTVPATIHS